MVIGEDVLTRVSVWLRGGPRIRCISDANLPNNDVLKKGAERPPFSLYVQRDYSLLFFSGTARR